MWQLADSRHINASLSASLCTNISIISINRPGLHIQINHFKANNIANPLSTAAAMLVSNTLTGSEPHTPPPQRNSASSNWAKTISHWQPTSYSWCCFVGNTTVCIFSLKILSYEFWSTLFSLSSSCRLHTHVFKIICSYNRLLVIK